CLHSKYGGIIPPALSATGDRACPVPRQWMGVQRWSMHLSLRLIWIWTVGIVASTTGCSREKPATTAPVGATGAASLTAAATSVPLDDDSRARASDRPAHTVLDTPDGAMRALLDGWGADNPEALWDALPAGYQQDVNDLVHLTARRLHPEAWRWF